MHGNGLLFFMASPVGLSRISGVAHLILRSYEEQIAKDGLVPHSYWAAGYYISRHGSFCCRGCGKIAGILQMLCENISVTDMPASIVKQVINNKKINDFEDGLEYFAAVESSCTCIITEDTGDFYFADIEVLTTEDFCMKYMVRLRT